MSRARNIEALKNILIVVLFLTTILLLYFLWENVTMKTFRLSSILPAGSSHSLRAEDVTRPEEIVFSFGAGGVTADPDVDGRYWELWMNAFQKYCGRGELLAEEISRAQFLQLTDYRAVFCRFAYDLPLESFCQQRGISNRGLNQIACVTEMGYSAGSPESVFLYDGRSGRCYRLVSELPAEGFEEIIRAAEQGEYLVYYGAASLFGAESSAVLPLNYSSTLAETPCGAELGGADDAERKAIAEQFFGADFGFVRRIEESQGSLIYMYGYDQKTLTFAADGSMVYREALNGEAGARRDYFEALQDALDFIENYGGWREEQGRHLQLRVRDAYEIESDRQKGYRFVFGVGLEGVPLYGGDGNLLTVEIYGRQVTAYRRCLPDGDLEKWKEDREKEAFSVVGLLSEGYPAIYEALRGEAPPPVPPEGEEAPQEGAFEWVAARLQNARPGLVRDAEREGSLRPAWVLCVDDCDFFYDLYSGEAFGAVPRQKD